ncbi:MAG: ATP-binding protein [Flavipsychrobacter sp.]|nr:ATP-binding protein [Flavipsychrobacter sp.]
MSNIHILSEPVHSGKSTLLMNWTKRQPDIAGVLMPDVNGSRKLYDIATQTYYDFQVAEKQEAGTIDICKWNFDEKIFELGRKLLLNAAKQKPEWLILDEVGKLEMNRHTGFEPAVTELVKLYRQETGNAKLLLVIRDYMLEQSFTHYGLNQEMVLPKTFFL